MPIETTARLNQPHRSAQQESDYQAFSAALSANERGRAFLSEYTRRNRNADTEVLLTAIDRLQTLFAANAASPSDAVKTELQALLVEIGAARSELESSVAAMRATKLAELIALVEQRIVRMLSSPQPKPEMEAEPEPPAPPVLPTEKPERTFLSVVAQPDQPELPIPSPISIPPPSIALVRTPELIDEPAPAATVTPRLSGPLASIMALSEEERLALFT